MEENFSEVYPGYKTYTLTCMGFWIIMLLLLLIRKDKELADVYNFKYYSGFLLLHSLAFLLIYASDKFRRGQKAVFYLFLLPSFVTGILILITVAGLIIGICKFLFA